MKNISFALVVLTIMTLSSCYIGVEGRHRRHAASIQIRTSNDTNPKDSLQSPALGNITPKDTLKSTAIPDPGK